ncbi:VOC family protein [Loktanella sp. DJP18]|uniref:VOC family protein n=1 Tax=Loktanella sp. DJP18 TaxID=3409788 RepID=UPI003BB644DB
MQSEIAMLTLDHIAIACTDLDTAAKALSDRLGVPLQPGGRHDRYGTHNRLLGLGDIYLELIALDPDAAPTGRPAWFGMDHFTGPARAANWICRTDDLRAAIAIAPVDPGTIVPLTRGDLHWRITVPDDGRLPLDGAMPTMIQWGDGVVLPATRLPDSGCRLLTWEVSHPQATLLREGLRLTDPRVVFVTGAMGLRATLQTPGGTVTL